MKEDVEGKDAAEEKAAEESKDSSTSSSGSASESEKDAEEQLSAKDIKRIKTLFNEQETEIKSLEKQISELEALSKRKD